MTDHLLRRNAQLFYNGSLIAQLGALGLLFLSAPYYAGVGASVAVVLSVLAVYSLTAGTAKTVADVGRALSKRSRLFVGLAAVIIIGSLASLFAQPVDAITVVAIVEAYARTALAIGATLLLLYADYQQQDDGASEEEPDPASRALTPDEIDDVDWSGIEE